MEEPCSSCLGKEFTNCAPNLVIDLKMLAQGIDIELKKRSKDWLILSSYMVTQLQK